MPYLGVLGGEISKITHPGPNQGWAWVHVNYLLVANFHRHTWAQLLLAMPLVLITIYAKKQIFKMFDFSLYLKREVEYMTSCSQPCELYSD